MSEIKMDIVCPSCDGTGVYVGLGERDGASVVCSYCKGTGKYEYTYHYEKFTKRKVKEGVKRVYKSSYGYVIAPKELDFKEHGRIDMSKEGVSYEEFLNGDMPDHVESLGCPMIASQGDCHKVKGFIDECNNLNGRYINYIPECNNQCNKAECWKRFKGGQQ